MEAQREAAERIGAALVSSGMARLPSRLFAALLVDDDGRMTSVELASFLGISSGGVSAAVRYLEQIGLVRREREPGGRRDVYVVDDDAWHDAMMAPDQLYAPIKSAMASAVQLLGDAPAATRVELSLEFLDFLTVELASLAERWEEHKRRTHPS
ncbi:DNA-binding transcriptional regulator GbsR, MarR family [Nocardioides terrae]|uniref:DNA-binding transcriptional regulator GbsR, MarR family n=1 Tax=Nocardioides terrae TaxID=574651 RepID=A0A1I1JRW1_9ACTN|nr:MarR family transcriptional regulator [Nocardioides terrae]SFC51105.1 DNA-binding transcriptional regulator GbsR, MarR family [Nocardioides terrae]